MADPASPLPPIRRVLIDQLLRELRLARESIEELKYYREKFIRL